MSKNASIKFSHTQTHSLNECEVYIRRNLFMERDNKKSKPQKHSSFENEIKWNRTEQKRVKPMKNVTEIS